MHTKPSVATLFVCGYKQRPKLLFNMEIWMHGKPKMSEDKKILINRRVI